METNSDTYLSVYCQKKQKNKTGNVKLILILKYFALIALKLTYPL